MRIISLTSIPPRFPFLYPTLKSLVNQHAADEIRLYIPRTYRRFPEYDGAVPEVPDGITVCQIKDDYGPATKILPAIADFRNKDAQILFCDDDGLFPFGWAARLFKIQAKRESQAIATFGRSVRGNVPENVSPIRASYARHIRIEHDLQYRCGRIFEKVFGGRPPLKRPIIFPGYVDILFGVYGVVVRPSFFDDEAFNIPDEAWVVDDIWLSAQLARNNVPIYCPWRLPCPGSSDASNTDSLVDMDYFGSTRQESNSKAAMLCQKMYGIWKT